MALTFFKYSKAAWETAIYPSKGRNVIYPALGLVGEAGEVSEKVKKAWRRRRYISCLHQEIGLRNSVAKELGDVLWYINALAVEFGLSLEEIALANLEKLKSRSARGTLAQGEGDER